MPSTSVVSNSGYIKAANIQAKQIRVAAAVDSSTIAGLALWQRFSSTSIANMQDEIAQANVKMSEELLDHYKKYWPHEKAFVDEMFAAQKPTENYEALSSTFKSYAEKAMESGKKLWKEYLDSKCQKMTKCTEARWKRHAGINSADVINFALRTEEARTQALIDRWYSRRKAALSLGNGVLDQMVGFQSAYYTSGSSVGNFIGGAINSLGEAAGYLNTGPSIFNSWGTTAQNTTSATMPPVTTSNRSVESYGPYSDRIVK